MTIYKGSRSSGNAEVVMPLGAMGNETETTQKVYTYSTNQFVLELSNNETANANASTGYFEIELVNITY